jgi:hypothetical protein
MEVHFTPEQEAQLAKIATTAGTNPEALVRTVALRLVESMPVIAIPCWKASHKPTVAN